MDTHTHARIYRDTQRVERDTCTHTGIFTEADCENTWVCWLGNVKTSAKQYNSNSIVWYFERWLLCSLLNWSKTLRSRHVEWHTTGSILLTMTHMKLKEKNLKSIYLYILLWADLSFLSLGKFCFKKATVLRASSLSTPTLVVWVWGVQGQYGGQVTFVLQGRDKITRLSISHCYWLNLYSFINVHHSISLWPDRKCSVAWFWSTSGLCHVPCVSIVLIISHSF